MFTLNEIVQAMTGKNYSGDPLVFREAVIDSRKVSEGELFAAIPGETTDGHRFISSAFSNGAAAALVQEDISGDFESLDLRNGGICASGVLSGEKPLCIRVENTVEALQRIAAYHRRQLPGWKWSGSPGLSEKRRRKNWSSICCPIISKR